MTKISLAGCIILNKTKDSILLLNRKKTNWYELPGGKINNNEDAEITAIRELKEELMCDVEIIKKIGTKDFEENGYIMTYNWFLAKIKQGQNPQIGESHTFDHCKFVPIKDLSNHKLSPNMENLVGELSSKRISLE